ncbi:MAG: DUF309 domain-containing protein [Actinomycetota bacterium]|nr:DUF309 domain-containing protein [Actinomycetota bacterium]
MVSSSRATPRRRLKRDRDEFGRPSNARPRDRLGRPLARDAQPELTVEEFDLHDPHQALATAIELWNEERFFEAHEVLEDVWQAAPEEDRRFWQGIIQVAVGCVHHQRGNVHGTSALLHKAADKLADYPEVHHGVDVGQLRVFAENTAHVVEEAQEIIDIGYPQFPALPGGARFGDDNGAPRAP